MTLLLRGMIWFGVYLLLVLLPAAVALVVDPYITARQAAVEISVALGLIAFPLILIQFALVSRLRASSRPFGTDALVQFHQQMGVVCLGLAVAHPLLLSAAGMRLPAWNPFSGSAETQSGAIALWTMVVIVATTVFRQRLRLPYEAWQAIHLVTALVTAAAIVLHVLAVNGYARAPVMRAVLFAYAGAFLALTVRYSRHPAGPDAAPPVGGEGKP